MREFEVAPSTALAKRDKLLVEGAELAITVLGRPEDIAGTTGPAPTQAPKRDGVAGV